jgi:MoaA/NifB/PqqE/SkfB family radical SAM enzyme
MTAPLVHDPDLGFCRFRIPLSGRRAIWEVTNACNYGCRYCIFGSTSRSPPGELDAAAALNVVAQLASSGFTHVKFTGGEPFLRPDMTAILARARTLGISCDVSTNASRIDADTAGTLAGLGLDMVHVSLDGPDAASHEAVRGKGTFAPSLTGLRLLVAAGVPVRVGCVVHARNEGLIPAMAAFCADLGAGSVVFSRMEPVGRMRGRPTLVTALDDEAIRAEVAQAADAHRTRIAISHNLDAPGGGCGTCPGGDRFAFVDHRGRVSPCTWVSEHRPDLVPEAGVADIPLADLLASPRIAGFRASVEAFSGGGARSCPMSSPEGFSGTEAAVAPAPGRFGASAPIYGFATENLAYVPSVVRPGDAALVLTGSGDHAVMAAVAGATRIESVDVNGRARLWALVKLAALASLTRGEFLGLLLPGPRALDPDACRKVAADLPGDAAAFLLTLSRQGASARSGPIFVQAHADPVTILRNVPYLRDDDAYLAARAAVAAAQIRFATTDVRAMAGTPAPAELDAILLSNLAEHGHRLFPESPLSGFGDRVAVPLSRRLRTGGRLCLYAFDAVDRRGSSVRGSFGNPYLRTAAYAALPGLVLSELPVASALDDAGPGDADAVLVLTRSGDA